MTEINIIIDGEAVREIEFQTLDDETAQLVIQLLLSQLDNTVAVLDEVGAINAEDPPEFGE